MPATANAIVTEDIKGLHSMVDLGNIHIDSLRLQFGQCYQISFRA